MANLLTSRWLRGGAWALASILGVVLLALAVVGVYTHTDHFRRWLRQQILAALRSSLNAEVSLERVSGSPWHELILHNLRIRQNGAETLVVPHSAISVGVLAQAVAYLSSSAIHVDKLTLIEPTLHLLQQPTSGWTIASLIVASEKPSTLQIFLDSLQITNGCIVVTPTMGVKTQFAHVSVAGSLASVPAGIHVTLSSLSFALLRPGAPEMHWQSNIEYDATQTPAVLLLHAADVDTAASRLRLSGELRDLSAPHLVLTAHVERLATADVRFLAPAVPLQQDLAGMLQVNGPLSALRVNADVHAPGGHATAAATLNLTQTPPRYQGELTIERLAMDKVFRLTEVSGDVSGRLSFEGATMNNAHGALELHAAQVRVRGRDVDTLTTSGALADGRAALSGAAHGAIGALSWRAELRLNTTPPAYDITLTARDLAAARIAGGDALPSAQINFDAAIKGSGTTLADMNGAATLTLSPSRIGPLTHVQGYLDAALHRQRLTLNTVRITANDTVVTAQGQLGDLSGTPSGSLTYTLNSQNLTPWLALIGQEGGGSLRATGAISGAMNSLTVKGDVAVSTARLGSSSLQNGAVTYAVAGLGGEQVQGQILATLMSLNAGLQWRTLKLNTTFAGRQPMELLTELTGQDQQGRAQRAVAQIRYQPDHVEALLKELTLQLPTGVWRTAQPARLIQHNDAFTIENLLLQHAQQAVSVSGTIAKEGAQDLRVQASRLALEDLRAFIGAGPQVSGAVSATVQVRGTAAQPEIQATLDTSPLTVAGQSYAGVTARGAYQQQQVSVNARVRQDATHELVIDGSLPLNLQWSRTVTAITSGDANIRLSSSGLSLALLNIVSTDVQNIQGVVSMDVQLRGPIANLAPSGYVQLQRAQAQVKSLALSIHDIAARVELAPDAVRLTELTARTGDGWITGNGRLTLQQYTLSTFTATVVADHFRVINTRQYAAAVSGQITGTGSWRQPVLQGELTLEDTSVRPDFSVLKSRPAPPDPSITVVRTEAAREAPASKGQATQEEGEKEKTPLSSGVYERLSLDLTVHVPRGTWVYLEEGNLELMGQVHIRKDPNQPVLFVGTIETVRGWYAFHGRKFHLEHGRVIFTGATPLDPTLDIDARQTLNDYQIDALITGTASKPELKFQSEPHLEQADILSLLIMGKTTGTLTHGEKSNLQSQVLGATAGYLANDVRRTVAEQLGIENVELDIGQTLSQSRLGVGTYVTEDVFVATSQSLGGGNTREFSVEYQLSENWQLKASATTRGNDGVDIIWRKRY
ncbi:MAG TPA: translocation/assembly module TamB domain-containing protein [Methylomirabilota bacterium]|jgi:hypothetical protein|nr:translocation/assembly module TamB domain-containing protein [Methylomirabilota bacterium]